MRFLRDSAPPDVFTVVFWALLNEHLSDVTLARRELNRVHPVIVRVVLHIVDGDHIAVGDEHVSRKVGHLRVQLHEVGHSPMDHLVPGIYTFDLTSLKAYPVSPKVAHLSDLKLHFAGHRNVGHFVGVRDHLEVELVEIGLNIHALQLGVHVLVDQHEVRVDLETAGLAHDEADMVALLRLRIKLRHGSVLEHGRLLHLALVD